MGGIDSMVKGLNDIIAGIGTQIGHLADIVANTAPIQGIKDILLGFTTSVSDNWTAFLYWCADLPNTMEGIGKSISASIDSAVDQVMTNIKAFVIPDTDVIAQSFDDLKVIAEEKVGVLGYPFVVLKNFFDLFTKQTSGRGCIVWGDAGYKGTVFWQAGEVCLADYVDSIGYQEYYNLYLNIIDGLLVLGTVILCANKFRRIFSR